jgi:predicted ferric reductase
LSIVTRVDNPLPDIFTVYFKSTEKQFKYKPGQFLHLTLSEYDPCLQWPESRCFSMQSSPDEGYLKITYSIKGTFTRQMSTGLKEGCRVWLKLPYGDIFQKPHSLNNCIFIAGGTGITPFLSLFTDLSFHKYRSPKLYFGLRNRNYNLYEDELEKAGKINTSFIRKIIYQDSNGFLDINTIIMENDNESTYFISGPPEMIKLFRNKLIEGNIKETHIITDDWE